MSNLKLTYKKLNLPPDPRIEKSCIASLEECSSQSKRKKENQQAHEASLFQAWHPTAGIQKRLEEKPYKIRSLI